MTIAPLTLIHRFSDISQAKREELSLELRKKPSLYSYTKKMLDSFMGEIAERLSTIEAGSFVGFDPIVAHHLFIESCRITNLFTIGLHSKYFDEDKPLRAWQQARRLFEFSQIAIERVGNSNVASVSFKHAYQTANLNKFYRELSYNQLIIENTSHNLSQPGSYLFRHEFARLIEGLPQYNPQSVAHALITTAVASLEEKPINDQFPHSPVQFAPMVEISHGSNAVHIPSESFNHCILLQDLIHVLIEKLNIMELDLDRSEVWVLDVSGKRNHRPMNNDSKMGQSQWAQPNSQPEAFYRHRWQYSSLPLNVYSSIQPVTIEHLTLVNLSSVAAFNHTFRDQTSVSTLVFRENLPFSWEHRVQKVTKTVREDMSFFFEVFWVVYQYLPKELSNLVKEYYLFDPSFCNFLEEREMPRRTQRITEFLESSGLTEEVVSDEELAWMARDMARLGVTLEELEAYSKDYVRI